MPGTFILSLDCEGKWGMADHLTPAHHRWLTSARLRDAYERLLGLFDEYDIDATFAFVMAFLLSPQEQRERDGRFQDQLIEGRNWLVNFRAAQVEGNMEGWSLPELLDLMRDHPRHEIGCHGFSHLPLAETLVSRAVMRAEAEAAAATAAELGLIPHTFVYPRNLVGYPDELAAFGYAGYRDRLPVAGGLRGRANNFMAELNLDQDPQVQAPTQAGGIVAIPSGFFFNWRLGPRRLVPRWVTVQRWRRLLAKAAADGGVVHLWLHPHNIISAPGTFDVLADVLRTVAKLRDAGRLEVVTQQRYCAARTG